MLKFVAELKVFQHLLSLTTYKRLIIKSLYQPFFLNTNKRFE